MKDNYQSFLASIALHQILPLMPLFIEFTYLGHVTDKSLTMTSAIYAFSIGVSSRSQATLGLCMLIGILMSASYGAIEQYPKESYPKFYNFLSFWLILVVFLIHLIERFRRHINENEDFLLIKKNK